MTAFIHLQAYLHQVLLTDSPLSVRNLGKLLEIVEQPIMRYFLEVKRYIVSAVAADAPLMVQ